MEKLGGTDVDDAKKRAAARYLAQNYAAPIEGTPEQTAYDMEVADPDAYAARPSTPTSSPGVPSSTYNAPAGTVGPTGPTAPTPADLAKQGMAGGPPPGFTGTFNGMQYQNGSPVNMSPAGSVGQMGPVGANNKPYVPPQPPSFMPGPAAPKPQAAPSPTWFPPTTPSQAPSQGSDPLGDWIKNNIVIPGGQALAGKPDTNFVGVNWNPSGPPPPGSVGETTDAIGDWLKGIIGGSGISSPAAAAGPKGPSIIDQYNSPTGVTIDGKTYTNPGLYGGEEDAAAGPGPGDTAPTQEPSLTGSGPGQQSPWWPGSDEPAGAAGGPGSGMIVDPMGNIHDAQGNYIGNVNDQTKTPGDFSAGLRGITNGSTTGTGATGTGGGGLNSTTFAPAVSQVTQQFLDGLAQIQSELNNPSLPPDVMGMYLSGLNQILQMLDKQEKDYRDRAAKEGSDLDPGTADTLRLMKEQLQDQLKASAEALNARGLYHSGVLLELENNLRKGNLSDQATLLGQRLSKIRDELTKNLAGLADQRFGAASSFTLQGAQAQSQATSDAANRRQNLQQMLLQGQLGLRGQLSSEAEAAAGREFTGQQNEANRQFEGQQNQFQRDIQLQLAALEREHQTALANAKTQADINMENQKYAHDKQLLQMQIDAGRFDDHSGGGSSAATAAAVNYLPAFGSKEEAISSLQQRASELIAAGVNMSQLYQAINQRWP